MGSTLSANNFLLAREQPGSGKATCRMMRTTSSAIDRAPRIWYFGVAEHQNIRVLDGNPQRREETQSLTDGIGRSMQGGQLEPPVCLRNRTVPLTLATTTMSSIEGALGSVIVYLSEENYERSLAQYRFLFELVQTYSQIPSDFIYDTIWEQIKNRQLPSHNNCCIFYHTSPLILRFAGDAESDSILASQSAGLRSRLCTSTLREFFDHGLGVLYRGLNAVGGYLLAANLIAHGVNLGYIEETSIRNHTSFSLTPHIQQNTLTGSSRFASCSK